MSALRKVLVVDDDPVVGKSFNRVLSQDKGYVVITAQNAAEALERLREQEYDVVFTDIKMPGMDGVELTERVKASRPWTPVVIITGYGTTANEQRAKAAGVSDFMRKPLSPEMIEESAIHALHQPALASVMTAPAAEVEAVQVELIETRHPYKNAALLLAAPFIGLAYAVLLPLVGIAMLGWMAIQSLATPARLQRAKSIALFLVAPFVGLAYAVLLPLVGVAMLLWTAGQAVMAIPSARKILMRVKDIALFVAAPFIGLIYAVMLPFVGITMLLTLAVHAWMSRPVKA
ncbi:response regulator [Rhodoferax sp.]|uniref:response regulator n=1 Tax=Rhodoferax sp. TaxID=50421 RepID=UPI002735B29B|nr:response regulator [Rhodoferax sp.]MDP3192997.1 response regulator [Rhodoferax sp.]MDP3335355.1 response regulator [Rhodoferax sp.]